MSASDEDVEQTLHIAREVSVYRIPPRSNAAGGHRSGEWKVTDKLFSGRLRVVARGELCEIRIEDPNSGDLFVVCPIPLGSRLTCVEPTADSSRYYVLRVEDPATKRHAFLGMGFEQRSDSFDFNEAMLSHEKHVQRARATTSQQGGAATLSAVGGAAGAGQAVAAKEVEALYQKRGDMGLKEGQTIRVNLKKPTGAPSTWGLISSGGVVPLVPFAPPPGAAAAARLAPPPFSAPTSHAPQASTSYSQPPQLQHQAPHVVLAPAAAPVAAAAPPAVFDPFADFFTLAAAVPPAAPAVVSPASAPAVAAAPAAFSSQDTGWATFD